MWMESNGHKPFVGLEYHGHEAIVPNVIRSSF